MEDIAICIALRGRKANEFVVANRTPGCSAIRTIFSNRYKLSLKLRNHQMVEIEEIFP